MHCKIDAMGMDIENQLELPSGKVIRRINSIYKHHNLDQEITAINFRISHDVQMLDESAASPNGNIDAHDNPCFLIALARQDNKQYIILSPCLHKIIEEATIQENELINNNFVVFNLLSTFFKNKFPINFLGEMQFKLRANELAIEKMKTLSLRSFMQDLKISNLGGDFAGLSEMVRAELKKRNNI